MMFGTMLLAMMVSFGLIVNTIGVEPVPDPNRPRLNANQCHFADSRIGSNVVIDFCTQNQCLQRCRQTHTAAAIAGATVEEIVTGEIYCLCKYVTSSEPRDCKYLAPNYGNRSWERKFRGDCQESCRDRHLAVNQYNQRMFDDESPGGTCMYITNYEGMPNPPIDWPLTCVCF